MALSPNTLPLDDPNRSGETQTSGSYLFLVLECGRPLAGGARFSLEGIDEVVLGRAATVAPPAAERSAERRGRRLTIGVPDPSISSRHARLSRVKNRWSIEDSGSTNGTVVEGRRVARAAVPERALFQLGSTLFCLRSGVVPAEEPDVLAVGADDVALGMATLVPSYARALDALRQVMRSSVSLLLIGETGTGKELLAQAAHRESRRSGSLVPVNCGAIPETLLESQLFGHVKGAFSGAVRDEPGFVRASDGGTLFLDEVGDLPLASQAAMLRVLQEEEVLSVGSTRAAKVSLRVVSATHRRVDALTTGAFRADLYARLAGFVHVLLPLRERREDLGLLLAALLPTLAPEQADGLRLRPEVGRLLYGYGWPLNVRELRNTLASALLFAQSGVLEPAQLPEAVREAKEAGSAPLREALVDSLARHEGNVSAVAREMGRTRTQIHRWIRRFGLCPDDHRPGGVD